MKLFKGIMLPLTCLMILTIGGRVSASSTPVIYSGLTGIGINHSVSDTARLNKYLRRSDFFLKAGVAKIELVRAYLDSAAAFCKKAGINIIPELYLLEARYSFETGDFSKTGEQLNLAEKVAEMTGDYKILAWTLNYKGRYYFRINFLKESEEAYKRSIEIAAKYRIKGVVQRGYQGLAEIMTVAKDFSDYRETLILMIRSAFEDKDTLSAESGLQKLGNSYIEYKRESFRADSVYRECFTLASLRKDTLYLGFVTANIGWNFYLDREYDSALYYYKKSLSFTIPGRVTRVSDNSFGNIGNIYRDLGQKDKAISFYNKSVEEALKIKDWYVLAWVYEDINKLYLNAGDTSNAYQNFVKFHQYNDSVVIREKNKGLTDARVRYEADTHRKEVELLSWRLKNNRLLNFGFAGLLVLIVLIAILIIRASRINAGRRLSEMNRKISEMRQANLRQQMNPHFIFNTLNSIQYYMYQHDKLATNNYLTKFSNLIRKVLENSQHTSISLQDELDALNLYLELESLRFRDKFDYNLVIDEEIDPVLFRVPPMLIQPYVENSINHGLLPLGYKGIVTISLSLVKKNLVCIVEDNGIGRQAAIDRSKRREDGHNSLGTLITNSRLDLVNSLYGTDLKTIYTDLKNEKGEAVGTRVEIQIPIMA